MLSVFESVGLLTLFFPYLSCIHRSHSTALIAVQPSFSTIGCKTLNIFIKACYSLPCLFRGDRREPCWPATRSFHLPHSLQTLKYYSYIDTRLR